METPQYLLSSRVERHGGARSGASYPPVPSGGLYPNEAAERARLFADEAAKEKQLKAQKLTEFQNELKARVTRQVRMKKMVHEITVETTATVPKTPPRVRASVDKENASVVFDLGSQESSDDEDRSEAGEGAGDGAEDVPVPPRSPAREDGRAWAEGSAPRGPADVREVNLAVRMQHAQAAASFARKSMAFSRKNKGAAAPSAVPMPELGSFGNTSPLKGFHRTCDHSHGAPQADTWRAGAAMEAERWGEGAAVGLQLKREEAARKLQVRRAEQAAERQGTVRRREQAELRSSIEKQQLEDLLTWEALHSGTGAPTVMAVQDQVDAEAVQRQRYRNQRMERVRIHDAKMEGIARKVKERGIAIPRLCSCIHTLNPLDSRYPFRCSNNCQLYRSPEAYMHVLSQLLHAYGLGE